jgi:23S rRNA (uracil1939-C5)-methyltransferase
MRECHVLLPELFALVAPLRSLLRQHAGRAHVDVDLAVTDQGVDCLIKGLEIKGYEANEDLLDLAKSQKLARLSLDQGWGSETMWEPEPVTVTLSGVPVSFPAGAFLQATGDGEKVLQDDAMRYCGTSEAIADLFAGLGTLSLQLAAVGKGVVLFEADQAAHLASRRALSRLNGGGQALHRDLFRAPLQPEELKRFDTVILDPPRAGAKAQIDTLAKSGVDRIVYVSCNPASWTRDAATLVAAGYRLEMLRPVGQFSWSTHVELSSLFVR